MRPGLRRPRAVAAVTALFVVLNVSAPPASGQASAADLAVADAFGFATPVSTVLRIPNQLDGGSLLSTTTFTLDKAQAIAAGYTPGELGEAFLRTTVVAPEGVPPEVGENIAYENPSLITAQTPPSPVFPAENSLADGGVNEAGAESASLRASTSERSSAADAVGGFGFAQDGLTVGSGGSRSTSELLDDGTVVSQTHAFVEDVRIANGLLRIASIDSVGRVSVRPGADPEMDLHIDIGGAQLAGIPVVIDQNGIRVADSGLLGAADLGVVNEALAALADQGFTVTLFPGVVRESDGQSATVAGAALSIRGDITDYVPTAVDTPAGPVGSPLGDVGTDNEILLGRIEASAFAAERGPLPDFATAPPPAIDDPPSPSAGNSPSPAPAGSGTPLPEVVETAPTDDSTTEVAAPADAPFELTRTVASPAVEALRIGYRWVLLSTLAGTIAYLVRRRARLI